jgi:beta-1,4-mannosyl-glycoprotein beta-1,4-N-acetylglucosaminyltransferase
MRDPRGLCGWRPLEGHLVLKHVKAHLSRRIEEANRNEVALQGWLRVYSAVRDRRRRLHDYTEFARPYYMLALRRSLRWRRRVFDCFMLSEEVDLLHLRLLEYHDVVDYFVIVEARRTFRGERRELSFPQHQGLFEPYLDKVIYLVVDDLPDNTPDDIWIAESYQRDYIDRGLSLHAEPGDLVILSDIDEFWDVDDLPRLKRGVLPIVLRQSLHYYYVNWRSQRRWTGTVVAMYGVLTPQEMRALSRGGTPDWVRVLDSGWHYSYLGGMDRIRNKLNSLSDAHLVSAAVGDESTIRSKIQGGVLLWDPDETMHVVSVDGDAPRCLPDLLSLHPKLVGPSLAEAGG